MKKKRMRLSDDEVRVLMEMRGLTENRFRVRDSQSSYRISLSGDEMAAILKYRDSRGGKRMDVFEGKPVHNDYSDCGDFYELHVNGVTKRITKDRLREVYEIYTSKGMTIERACLALQMTRRDFMLFKNAFHFIKDGLPFPDFDFDGEMDLQEMADYTRMKRKVEFWNRVERDRVDDMERRIKCFDKADYWHTKAIDGLKGIERQLPYVLGGVPPGGTNRAVLVLADAHVGLRSSSVFNVYGVDIFRERMATIAHRVKWLLLSYAPVSLDVVDLGDGISGEIHSSLRAQNEISPAQQLRVYVEETERMLRTLSSLYPVSYRYCQGNHERVDAGKDAATDANHWGNLIAPFLDVVFRDVKHVDVVTEQPVFGVHEIAMFDYWLLAEHGHRGKAERVAADWMQLMGKQYREIFLGHLHHRRLLDDNGTLVHHFPSICGVDEYATHLRKVSKPGATLLIYNRTGRVAELPIDL